MLISYGRPAMTWAIAGTGASFVSASSILTNGRPADPCRIQWLSGAQTTSSTVTLTATLATAIVPRCAAVLLPNLSTAIPAGVKITVSGKLGASSVPLGGNALTQRTVTLPNGATAIWFVFPLGLSAIDTLIVTIYNDANSATWATASQFVDLGEVWVGKGADFQVAQDPDESLQGGVLQRQSRNNQAWALLQAGGNPFRVLTVNLQPMTEAVAIGPNSAQDDFETVRYQLATASACVLIPAYLARGNSPNNVPNVTSGTISAQRLHRSARLGVLDSPPSMKGNGSRYYVAPLTHCETPP
jgi:hypothetical protein